MSDRYDEASSLFAEAVESGVDPEALAEYLDALVSWNHVLPQPAGAIAEAVDGAAAEALIEMVRKASRRIVAWWKDPERKARAMRRRAERRARRAARREADEG